jgi:hypothetical protein
MATTKIDGLRQIQDESIKRELLELDFLKGSNLNLTDGNNNATITGLSAGVNPTDAVTKAQLDAVVIDGGMVYRGVLDASDATGAALDGAQKGDFFYISVAGTLNGLDFNPTDHLVVNAGITDFDVDGAGKIEKVDNTESADILRDGDIVNDLTTGGTTQVLSAQQGVVLKSLVDGVQSELDDTQAGAGLNTDGTYASPSGTNYIDASTSFANADALLDAQVGTNASNISTNSSNISDLQTALLNRVFGEVFDPSVTTNTYTVANFPIDAGTLRVYINGIRQRVGAGNDYTVNESTGVITFADNLKANKDVVVIDYEY